MYCLENLYKVRVVSRRSNFIDRAFYSPRKSLVIRCSTPLSSVNQVKSPIITLNTWFLVTLTNSAISNRSNDCMLLGWVSPSKIDSNVGTPLWMSRIILIRISSVPMFTIVTCKRELCQNWNKSWHKRQLQVSQPTLRRPRSILVLGIIPILSNWLLMTPNSTIQRRTFNRSSSVQVYIIKRPTMSQSVSITDIVTWLSILNWRNRNIRLNMF